MVPKPSGSIPKDVDKWWTQEVPTFEKPFIGDLQESGCIALNKGIHQRSLQYIIQLNENKEETYKHVHGDKETFWLGCEMSGIPYCMNVQRPYTLVSKGQKVAVVQFIGKNLFYQQKKTNSDRKEVFF